MDQLLLQRFVDRRLSAEELRQLARQAQERPECWRELACAVIEDQLWQQAFLTTEQAIADGRRIAEAPRLAAAAQTSPSPGRQAMRSPFRANHQWLQWAVVACCLVAMPLLYWAGQSSERGTVSPRDIAAIERADPARTADQQFAATAVGGEPANSEPASRGPSVRNVDHSLPRIHTPYSLQLINNDQIRSTPLMLESTAREIGYRPAASSFPAELQSRLRRKGYQLDSKIYFLRGNTPDGRQIVVPIESVGLSPFGQ